jgi:Helix-turn-helix domain
MKLYELERQARRLALPASQKAVLTCLISYSNRNGDGTSIFPGVATIAKETSLCRRTVQYSLRELETVGWIKTINRKGGYSRPTLYHLNLDQFGALAARPIDRPAPPERSLQQQLNYAYGMLKRLAEDSPARERWEQKVARLEEQYESELSPASTGQGDSIERYHQALVEYQAGYTGQPQYVLPAPGIETPAAPLTEAMQLQVNLFNATLSEQMGVLRAQLAERRQYVLGMEAKIAARQEAKLPESGIFKNLKINAEAQIREIQAALADLREQVNRNATQVFQQ